MSEAQQDGWAKASKYLQDDLELQGCVTSQGTNYVLDPGKLAAAFEGTTQADAPEMRELLELCKVWLEGDATGNSLYLRQRIDRLLDKP